MRLQKGLSCADTVHATAAVHAKALTHAAHSHALGIRSGVDSYKSTSTCIRRGTSHAKAPA